MASSIADRVRSAFENRSPVGYDAPESTRKGLAMPIDLNQLRAFIRVAQTGSFTGAARNLGMTKSTLSRQVVALEEELGASLLVRTTRQLRLTTRGRALLRECAALIDGLAEAERDWRHHAEQPSGTIRVTSESRCFCGWSPTAAWPI